MQSPSPQPPAAVRSYAVAIIGSGFGGQCAAIGLLRRGVTDFVILERRGFMGGTWCQNRYPGAAVDVPSPLYSIAAEPYPWSQLFAEGPELERYTHAVIDKHGLRDKAVLGAEVCGLRWLSDRGRWRIETHASGVFEARVVINASGPLSAPVVPQIPGRATFAGAAFHTHAWDRGFDPQGKRVAVVGSGASAAQVIPALVDAVDALHVFQRTPHWVLPRPDHRFSAPERALLAVGPVQRLVRWSIYWKLEARVVGFKYSPRLLDLFAGRTARRHLARQVPDPELRRKLTPDYTIGCKRIILSDTLYPALGRPHVTLHDRDDAIAAIEPGGVRTATGRRVELDAIVWATGYDAIGSAVPYPVIGRGGRRLDAFWRPFPRAYLGTTMPGFPNFFVLTGPNTGIGHTSALFVIESQLAYVFACLDRLEACGAATIEVGEAAEAAYTAMIHREMRRTVWHGGGCRSWYHSDSGHVVAMFPGFSFSYRLLAQRFRPADHQCV